ncbi:MAG: TolC family protein [Alistipes sp.]
MAATTTPEYDAQQPTARRGYQHRARTPLRPVRTRRNAVDHTQLSTSLGPPECYRVRRNAIKHDIAGQKFSLQASLKDLERAREDVSLNVTSLYLQVLLNKEMVKVAENQVELSRQQVERSELLVKNGRNPESDLYESKALLANDEMNLTQSRNTLLLSLLDLSQALNLENKDGFDIRMPDLGNITIASMSRMETPGTVYDYAVGNRPRILAEQLRLKSSEKALLSAKSAFYPSISLGAGYSNGYYFSIYEGARNAAFFNQLKNNGSEYIGLSINIPIFNRNATRNNVRMAQNNIRIQELAITEAQLALRKEIEQSYYSADAAYQKYLSAEKSLAAAREAFRYQKEKADAGRSTIFDYNDAKTRMEKSESDMVQAKFNFIFSRKILDFYAGQPLDFSIY